MNRVNFKGCVEKDELLKILQRLWKQEQMNKDNIESMEDESLCKICMDSPVSGYSKSLDLTVKSLFLDRLCDVGVWTYVYLH